MITVDVDQEGEGNGSYVGIGVESAATGGCRPGWRRQRFRGGDRLWLQRQRCNDRPGWEDNYFKAYILFGSNGNDISKFSFMNDVFSF